VVNGRPGPAPSLLPAGVTEEQLRLAVAGSRSWRGVLQHLGLKSSSVGPRLRNACNTLDIDYGHFRSILATDGRLREVITASADWPTALATLGYAKGSGTARATVRKHCNRLGIHTDHLAPSPLPRAGSALIFDLAPKAEHLRDAGPHLVLFAFNAAGLAAALAPEGAAYDVVADFGSDGLKRIQVKTCTGKDAGSWRCQLSRSEYDRTGHGGHRRGVYSSEEIDYFACIDGDLQLYLIPIELVEGQATIQLRKYSPYRVAGLYGDPVLL
jgi:hypothetical protein